LAASGPIGVFDSGLGGLTVVRALRRKLPRETIVYFGDSARVPYGNKSPTLVRQYSREISEFLIEKGAKLIVVACNTASALALEELRETFQVPIIGVIEPGAEAAVKATQTGHVGVIGTLATVRSGAYEKALVKHLPSVKITSKACPLFVPLVEEGWTEGDIPERVARTYLTSIRSDGVDTLILGCTHYPLLTGVIGKVMTSAVTLVDSAETTALETEKVLIQSELLADAASPGELDCFVSDLPLRFEQVAQRFLGAPVSNVSEVQLH
jgi:glutamate racemase